MKEIGYLTGSDCHRGLAAAEDTLSNTGSCDIYKLRSQGPRDYTRLHYPPNYFRLKVSRSLERFDVLLNLVTDPDINSKVLKVLSRVLVGFEGVVINHPDYVLNTHRDKISELLTN